MTDIANYSMLFPNTHFFFSILHVRFVRAVIFSMLLFKIFFFFPGSLLANYKTYVSARHYLHPYTA